MNIAPNETHRLVFLDELTAYVDGRIASRPMQGGGIEFEGGVREGRLVEARLKEGEQHALFEFPGPAGPAVAADLTDVGPNDDSTADWAAWGEPRVVVTEPLFRIRMGE